MCSPVQSSSLPRSSRASPHHTQGGCCCSVAVKSESAHLLPSVCGWHSIHLTVHPSNCHKPMTQLCSRTVCLQTMAPHQLHSIHVLLNTIKQGFQASWDLAKLAKMASSGSQLIYYNVSAASKCCNCIPIPSTTGTQTKVSGVRQQNTRSLESAKYCQLGSIIWEKQPELWSATLSFSWCPETALHA